MNSSPQSSCVLCGCRNPHPPPMAITPNFIQSKTKSEDIIRINNEISRVEQQMDLLRGKRSSLLNRLNDTQSITSNIPPEILSHIMEMAVADLNTSDDEEVRWNRRQDKLMIYAPLSLSAVSSYWRHVARSTPRIWTSLRLELDNRDVAVWNKKVALLRYYFARAKSLPLSLAFVPFEDIPSHNIKPLLDVALLDNSTQIAELYISNVSVVWPVGEQYKYPQLHVVYMSMSTFFELTPITFPALPALQSLDIIGVRSIKISTNTITHLRLSQVQHSDCIRLLLECRDTLVEFECGETREYESDQSPWLENGCIYTLPRLESFSWTFDCTQLISWDLFILQCLDLPSLQDMDLFGIMPHHARISDLKLFNRASYTMLCAMYIETGHHTLEDPTKEEDIMRLFKDIDTQTFFFYGSKLETLSILQALTRSRHPEGKIVIPSLKMLSLPSHLCFDEVNPHLSYEYDTVDEYVGDVRSASLHMLEERLLPAEESSTANKEPFILALPCISTLVQYHRYYEEKLPVLIQSGVLQLSLYKDVLLM